ncbi:MAG: hypothetical protein DUD26_06010 [Eubacteriaceae bacterium]|uniref:Uncharacterized protein n=1 Tax=Candidatus Pseudoramibacter fermentans TaxID=2594427 RepID=A0A6L5GPR4_9FIRM|nr:hypothetical protein [Candidatus Pseudoramibacter fermentans]RRF92540.1 MAG: hypothetical protein DUD26_06010 [Eubacteriaceae bacterium]
MININFFTALAAVISAVAAANSVSIAKKQLKESKIEFQKINRAFIEMEYFQENLYFGVRLTNHGNRTAINVKLSIDQDFIESIKQTIYQDILKEYNAKSFQIGVGQKYDIFIGKVENKRDPGLLPLKMHIYYEWKDSIHREKNQSEALILKSFEDDFEIDIKNYVTIYHNELNELEKKKVKSLENIHKDLEEINSNINKLSKTEEQ